MTADTAVLQRMSEQSIEDFQGRGKWILRLLYAPVDGECSTDIVGKRRLMKGCFLLSKKFESLHGIQTEFSFSADKYGPLDGGIESAVDELEKTELLNTEVDMSENNTRYSLTGKGEERAEELYWELDDDERKLIRWIKSEYVFDSQSKFLSFLYNQYPEIKEE